jgi:hypothetical protein
MASKPRQSFQRARLYVALAWAGYVVTSIGFFAVVIVLLHNEVWGWRDLLPIVTAWSLIGASVVMFTANSAIRRLERGAVADGGS